jgi:multidrug efflux system membrane fusion protein
MTRAGRIGFAVISLLLVAGAVFYWSPWTPSQEQPGAGKGKGKGKGGNRPEEAVSVLAIDARLADVPVYLDGVGTAKARNTVTVRAQVDGKLVAILFTEGLDVAKGDILAKIDPTLYQALYDQAVAKKAQDEATLANARLDLERYLRLAASNAVNKQQVDTQRALVAQLEAQVKADQAMIDSARATLSYTDITAPLKGRTGIRQVDEGNIVHASDATGIVVITELQPITVTFNLPQQDLPRLNKVLDNGHLPIDALDTAASGDKEEMDSEGDKDTKAKILDRGKVLVVDNQVDQTTGTIKLKAEFPNAKLQLWPGQFVNVRVLIETLSQVVVVPTGAVQRDSNNKTIVYVVGSDNRARIRPVEVALQDDRRAVIKSGLSAGEIVVTVGFGNLRNGSPVKVGSQDDGGSKGKGKGKGRRFQSTAE